MSTFRTSYEQRKWDNLTSEARQALENLSKGVTTMEDLKKASSLISKYQKLASSVFAVGIKAIEDSAKAQVLAIQEQMEKEGKAPLTEERLTELLDKAVEEGWSENGVELTALLEELIKAGFEDQEKSVSKIDQLLNQYLPELVTRDYMESVNRPTSDKSEKEPSAIKRALLKESIKDAIEEVADDKQKKSRSAVASTINGYSAAAANDPSVVALPPDVQEDLKEVLEDQHRIKENLDETVKKTTKADPKEEEKKANIWLRAWKASSRTATAVGRSLKSRNGVLGALTGLLALGGRALLAELTGGKISNVIDKYLDPDKLKIAFADFWQIVKRNGRSIVDYIVKGASWLGEKAGFIDTNENLVGKYESALNDARSRAEYFGNEQKRWKDLAGKTSNSNTRSAYQRRSDNYGKKREQAIRDASKFEEDKKEAQRRVDEGIQEIAPPLARNTEDSSTSIPQAPRVPTSPDTTESVDPTLSSPTDVPDDQDSGGLRGLLKRWLEKDSSGAEPASDSTIDYSGAQQGTPEDLSRPYFGGPRNVRPSPRSRTSTRVEDDEVSFSGGVTMDREFSESTESQAQRNPEVAGGGPITSIAGIGYSSSVDGVLGIVNAGILAS